eukprot:TRINITY_DN14944_c0_g1_i1.p1 TRINITY_DN14944_c0_g1~~TRINITY_DN14944_c0_g1_i1.p1  ORF type:complete len:739 (+),score=151.86 TRINITY_DN14944_c0_g1_i1:56-2272(+)
MSTTMRYPAIEDVKLSDILSLGLSESEASSFYKKLKRCLDESGADRARTWNLVSQTVLKPAQPFALHQLMYYSCYRNWDSLKLGPPPAWIPSEKSIMSCNLGSFLQRNGKSILGSDYKDPVASFACLYQLSVENPEIYWKMLLSELDIQFHVPPSQILEFSVPETSEFFPGGRWLPGALLNAAENCLLESSKRKSSDPAIIWRGEQEDDLPLKRLTLEQLRQQVWELANALETLHLPKGSSIAIDMPMVVHSVIIYLAVILAGYVVVSIADSFASHEISTRLKISNAKAIFTQDVVLRGNKVHPLYTRVIEAGAPTVIVVPSNGSKLCMSLRDGDLSFEQLLQRIPPLKGTHGFSVVPQPIEAASNILFSSGTTGAPKAIPWTHATPLKAAADAWAHLDIQPGDVVAWPTNLGWMMGPWLVYASLINGACIALYEGSPTGIGFAKFVQDAKVTVLGLVPSLVRSWKNTKCTDGFDWSNIRCFGSTGEASNTDDYLWLMGRAYYKPVIEYCGGTEIGGGFVTGSMLQAQSLSLFSTPAMGCKIYILGEDGVPLPKEQNGIGELALDPSIFGSSTRLLNANHYDVYFKGMPRHNGKILRRHGDEFEKVSGGYYKAHGRADDTMNLGGIKVSSIEIERICNRVDETILETAAVGIPQMGGGPEGLLVIVVFKNEIDRSKELEDIKNAFNRALQKHLNPLFKVSYIASVPSLPRTASNKVMRRTLRAQFADLAKSVQSNSKL